jgi:TIR domain
MKIFISWSGERSRSLAETLRQWLPDVMSFFEPWVSSEDIDRGARWQAELAHQLKGTEAGIICVTPENRAAPWIMFEAGALSNALDSIHVCTYLLGLSATELEGPLVQFQAASTTREDSYRLLQSLNKQLGSNARTDTQLQRVFAQWWPELSRSINTLSRDPGERSHSTRSERELLEEILLLSRQRAKFETSEILQEFAMGGIAAAFMSPEIAAFAAKNAPEGGDADKNAVQWASSSVSSERTLSGIWASRWNEEGLVSPWVTGSAAVAVRENRFAILHEDDMIESLVLGERSGDILKGQEFNLRVPRDVGPWVGRVVSSDRIDGRWMFGRWDLRR